MTGVRLLAHLALAALVAACGSPTAQQRVAAAELSDLAALKRQYPDVVMGFDLRPRNTLVISLDLQNYIEMDDDSVAALKRAALARWRSAWAAEHPHAHAVLHLRFIDFIGRKVAEETTRV
jgi:hypothetical protein